MRETKGEKVFYVINGFLLLVFALICLYPIIYVLSASFSSAEAVASGRVILLPKDVSIGAYRAVFAKKDIWVGYANSIYYTVAGVAVNLLLTIFGAYPLSRKKLIGKKFLLVMVLIALFFNAGTVPNYLNYVQLGLLNTRLAIILGAGCASMYVIIMRTFFQSIPDSLEEAAIIDGANQWQVLWKIVLPLSRAAIATVGLMYGVGRWNSYFWAMVLLQNEALQPLQVILKRITVDVTFQLSVGGEQMIDSSLQMITYAVIMVSIIPMMIAYPFVQKYFEKGIMIGAVKG